LKILVYDLKEIFPLSYVDGFKREIFKSKNSINLSIHSNEIFFILNNEFGWDGMHIIGHLGWRKFLI
tara:strand:+ start:373 stop:573 length:201 start_codon:yes stop_codon:yes gene_type:complete